MQAQALLRPKAYTGTGESRQIKQRGVYAITAFFSIFAHPW